MRCGGRPGERRRDNLVTRFCEVVTPRDILAKLWRAGFATTELGEAMAPASESPPCGGNRSGAGAAPTSRARARVASLAACALLALAGCGDDDRPRQRPAETT